jgi:hypothetical protein
MREFWAMPTFRPQSTIRFSGYVKRYAWADRCGEKIGDPMD